MRRGLRRFFDLQFGRHMQLLELFGRNENKAPFHN